jgi:hypothetical protein
MVQLDLLGMQARLMLKIDKKIYPTFDIYNGETSMMRVPEVYVLRETIDFFLKFTI